MGRLSGRQTSTDVAESERPIPIVPRGGPKALFGMSAVRSAEHIPAYQADLGHRAAADCFVPCIDDISRLGLRGHALIGAA